MMRTTRTLFLPARVNPRIVSAFPPAKGERRFIGAPEYGLARAMAASTRAGTLAASFVLEHPP
jgi:hypothetical protein